jgi:hypothetical protein
MTPTEIERFDRKRIQRGDNMCWAWAGSLNPGSGYPQLRIGRGKSRTMAQGHKVAYELANGPIPDGLHVLHRCGNRTCTNPRHLYAGDRLQNMADMRMHGGSNSKVLKPRDVIDIVGMRQRGAKYADIAAKFAISHVSVANVCSGRTYSRLTGITPRARA